MIVSHLLLILHKKIQFYIFMFEAWNVAKGRKGQGGEYFRKALYISSDNLIKVTVISDDGWK